VGNPYKHSFVESVQKGRHPALDALIGYKATSSRRRSRIYTPFRPRWLR